MRLLWIRRVVLLMLLVLAISGPKPVFADGNIQNVEHIIILMQENHSFDNYFGALAYAPGSPYHNGFGRCQEEDHNCVNGLSCPIGTTAA